MTKQIDTTALGVAHVAANYGALSHVQIRDGKAYAADGYVAARADLAPADEAHTGVQGAVDRTEPALIDGETARGLMALDRRFAISFGDPWLAWFEGERLVWYDGVRRSSDLVTLGENEQPYPDVDAVFAKYDREPIASVEIDPAFLLRACEALKQFVSFGDDFFSCALRLVRGPVSDEDGGVRELVTPVFVAERSDGRRMTVVVMPRDPELIQAERTQHARAAEITDDTVLHFAPTGMRFDGNGGLRPAEPHELTEWEKDGSTDA